MIGGLGIAMTRAAAVPTLPGDPEPKLPPPDPEPQDSHQPMPQRDPEDPGPDVIDPGYPPPRPQEARGSLRWSLASMRSWSASAAMIFSTA